MSDSASERLINIAVDGYPIVESFPRIVHEHNLCSYPLHPTNNYHGEGNKRAIPHYHIPPEQPLIIVPHWQEFAPGEWRWCPRCTRRNVQRLARVKKLYEASMVGKNHVKTGLYRHPALKDWRPGGRKLGGRFVTASAQTTFANQHAPENMAWCAWAYHYVSLDDLASQQTRRNASVLCVYCYKRWGKFQALQRFREHKAHGQQDYRKFHELLAQITAAKRELIDLRRLKESIAQEILSLQRQVAVPVAGEPEERALAPDCEPWTTGTVRPPQRANNTRRKAYSMA